jgi:mannosyltransferase
MVMAPSLGWRFSGINATMEALLPVMRKSIPIACCGANLSEKMPVAGLWKWLRSANRRRWRIWHARRNNDMLLGLLLRYVLRQKLILVWTSAAQRYHTWLTRFCYHRMDGVLATTQKAAGFLDCPSEVSHHGVNIEQYQPVTDKAAARRELGLREARTIGVFGRVRPQKGTGDLVEAILQVLPQHPEWRVVFVGQVTSEFVPYQKQMEDKLAAAGLADRVQFTGFLKDFSELPGWYRAMDVVACVSRNEGFGVTCLEGMASGAAVLGTEAGAWPDIICNGVDGWVARAADPADLARALAEVCATTPEALVQMGAAARRKIEEQFTIDHESERVISLYERMFEQFGEENWKSA